MLMKRTITRLSRKWKHQRRAAGSNAGAKALSGSISGFCRVLAVSAITALGLGEARAATLFWDPGTGGILGGNGTWDTTSPQWWNGVTDSAWNNLLNNTAVFPIPQDPLNQGVFVNLVNDVTVGALTFGAGYSVSSNFNTITIASTIANPATKTITVTNSSDTATIGAELLGTGGFTKAGAGTLKLTADSSAGITGGITIAGGTLDVNNKAGFISTGILNSANAVNFTSTSTLQFTATTGGSTLNLSALTFNGGEGTVKVQADSPSDFATLTFSSLGTRAAGATGNFIQNGTGIGNTKIVFTTLAPTIPAGGGFISQGLFFTDGFGNNNFAFYDAGGFVRGINYGVDANTATQTGSGTGFAPGSAGKHVQVTADVTGQGNITIRTLNLAGTFTANGGILQNPGTTITLTSAGILKSGGGFAPISGGILDAGSNELVIRADAALDALKISSVVTGSGGLTKSGQGSLELNPQTPGALSLGGSSTTSGTDTVTLASAAPAGLFRGCVFSALGFRRAPSSRRFRERP